MTMPQLDPSQDAVIRFLASPATHGGADVETIETHASLVFLAGDRALKLKRAVKYDYLDFSTIERRRACCEAELRINRTAAPMIYRRVVAVTREGAGQLAIGGSGPAVDWVVEMTRFDQESLLNRLADAGRLELALMRPLAAAVADFHAAAARSGEHGGGSGLEWVIEGNGAGCVAEGAGILDPARCFALLAASRGALRQVAALLDTRRARGCVRRCHGDLHLGNVVVIDGRPVLFDAVEFNDEIAFVDVLYDLAFLLMDLAKRGLHAHANGVLNAYLGITGDYGGLPLLPLFLSARAAIRAKTSAAAARLAAGDEDRQRPLRRAAREYLDAAIDLLRPRPASIVAIGGMSGTGKSTLAAAIAPALGAAPGAVVLRSDELRKRLCGVPALSRLGPEAYTAEVSHHVYDTLRAHAEDIARGGHAAVVDAVFMDAGDRAAIQHAAASARVPFLGFWLEAPEPVLLDRVRQRAADASDADAAVIRMQAGRDAGTIGWHRLDASVDAATLRDQALRVLRNQLSSGLVRAA
jgi:aminoglycoside phosphotransferase family enzyme/predicted kinase